MADYHYQNNKKLAINLPAKRPEVADAEPDQTAGNERTPLGQNSGKDLQKDVI